MGNVRIHYPAVEAGKQEIGTLDMIRVPASWNSSLGRIEIDFDLSKFRVPAAGYKEGFSIVFTHSHKTTTNGVSVSFHDVCMVGCSVYTNTFDYSTSVGFLNIGNGVGYFIFPSEQSTKNPDGGTYSIGSNTGYDKALKKLRIHAGNGFDAEKISDLAAYIICNKGAYNP